MSPTRARMPYQRISVEDKQRIVDAHERGEDYVALARQLNTKRTTAYAIIRRTQANGGRVALPRGGVRAGRNASHLSLSKLL